MSSDDQYFLDVLSSIPNDVRRYSMDVAEAIDRHVDQVVGILRDTLTSSGLLPPTALPKIPPRMSRPSVSLPRRYYESVIRWISRHKLLTAGIVTLVAGRGCYMLYMYMRPGKRRRARRAGNGARKEVVVIAGSIQEPLCKSLALDLERRGFIVYIVVNSMDEEQLVHQESRADIRPLTIDITEPSMTHAAIERFTKFLLSPQHPFPGAHAHHLRLTGFILIPNTIYPSGPLEMLSPEIWSDTLNVKVLGSVATTQAFLRTISAFKARILILTPNIIPSLSLPFHGIESAVVSSLGAYAATLRAELAPGGINVSLFKLGAFDYGTSNTHHARNHQQQQLQSTRADLLTWPTSARNLYGGAYLAQESSNKKTWSGQSEHGTLVGGTPPVRGSPLRDLHYAVFDALTMTSRPKAIWHVGRGSLLYEYVGRWAPPGIVGRMLGMRGVTSGPSASARPSRVPSQTQLSEEENGGWVTDAGAMV
ncbi:MAG: Vacuolar protein sorting-associated protein 53 [Watsoniomyces obsoletus]|nr:MAG: Vacuolar protein sorting-associated protein 53 [Watsoniomyces obsoletus]